MATGGEKRAALLRQITEEGGFAFVASAEKAAAGDLRAAEAAREMAWEQLHSAPRAEVGAAWRDAYALACLHVAALRAADDRRDALRALDMGLIMGEASSALSSTTPSRGSSRAAPRTRGRRCTLSLALGMWRRGGRKGSLGTETLPMCLNFYQ